MAIVHAQRTLPVRENVTRAGDRYHELPLLVSSPKVGCCLSQDERFAGVAYAFDAFDPDSRCLVIRGRTMREWNRL